MSSVANILLIDDSPQERLVILEALKQEFPGRTITTVVTRQDFEHALDKGDIGLVVADYHLGWASGVELVRSVKDRFGDCPGVMFAGSDPVRRGTIADSAEVAEAFQKTLDSLGYRDSLAYLLAAVRHGLEMAAKSREMQDVQNRYRDLFNHVPIGLYRSTPDGRILDANPAMVQMLGYSSREDLVAVDATELYMDRESRERWQAELAKGLVRNFEVRLRRCDGEPVWVRESCRAVTGGPRGVLDHEGAMEDITELKRAEEALELSQAQLLHAQKMEAIGRLAGGIAHDFNNLLMVISGYSELLLVQAGDNDQLRHPIDEMVRAVHRATALTGQLLAFGRRQVLVPRVIDVNGIVKNMHEMLQRLIGEDIELRTVPGSRVDRVLADPGQLEQVILNLAINARDAMPGGGRLTIETAGVRLDEEYCQQHPDVKPGQFVMLAVSDTGSGIEPEVLDRIFEPFFTTKEAGRGSGLGLSTVYGIVQQSGGTIWVYSEPGQGSSFKIYLPRVEAAPDAEADLAGTTPDLAGSGTVLLVEDDATVRGLIRQMLMRLGYGVLESPSGNEALRHFQHAQEPIDLLLTDVVMPGMGGRELARLARDLRPDLKVLYMSGYTDGAISERSALEPGAAFVEKPFAFARLAQAIRELSGS